MTEPTDAALFKALKDLIVEAQAVADDHHRPRYKRLDQALASARNAMLDYWAATPQPTQAQAEPKSGARSFQTYGEVNAYSKGYYAGKKAATQAQAGAVPLTCEWTHNDDDSSWDTECGQSWRFDDGGPKENHMNFCHCCGKPLRIKGGQHGTE